jgi:hypothetical protein
VLVVFVGDHYGITIDNIAEAVFGQHHAEIQLQADAVVAWMEQGHPYYPGLFFREFIGLPALANLSAVIACEWFDTLNRNNPGKRFNCTVHHHWGAEHELPAGAFSDFRQVIWDRRGPDVWEWEYSTEEPRAARLPPQGGIEFGIYSADNPW